RINYHHRPELLRHPPHDRSQWADRAGQLDRLLHPPENPPRAKAFDETPRPEDEDPWPGHEVSVDLPEYMFDETRWPDDDITDDDITDAALLERFRRLTADIDFWEWVTGDHHHGSIGVRGP
ncbi:hypothetical protein BST17_11370, partial [Mycolicibacterium bacteremicum]